MVFDITFFFFVIVILLAIIQGTYYRGTRRAPSCRTLLPASATYGCGCLLLCLAAGLIIDAFGELRDQLEQVREDMEVSQPETRVMGITTANRRPELALPWLPLSTCGDSVS